MASITSLKCQIIDGYSALLKKVQKGYPIKDYETIKEAMLALDYLDRYPDDITSNKKLEIVEHYTIEFIKYK